MNIQSEFRDRVVEAYGTDKAVSISKSCDIPVSTLQSMLAGSLPRVDNLVALAAGAKVDVGWLATGEGLMRPERGMFTPKTMPMHDFRTVPRYNATASAGHGSFPEYAQKLDDIPFTEDFLWKRLGRMNTDGLIIVDAAGDSMEPTIRDGDLIMVDMDKSQLTAAIYAFTYEDSFFVKRLNHLPDAIEATSDNKGYASFIIERQQMNRVNILGRVVWVGHTP